MMNNESVSVTCYSGRDYPDRPTSFVWRGRKYEVKLVEKEWLEPGERHFTVRTRDDRTFMISYRRKEDRWSLVEIEA
ncbi:MAG: DUF6504 family protein [Chloroflexota bacterium]|nr:DUF6504 family protein [Chloroflexota bacterium]